MYSYSCFVFSAVLLYCFGYGGTPPQGQTTTESADHWTLQQDVDERNLICPNETFKHYYRLKEYVTVPHLNEWMPTKIDEYGFLRDICLMSNGLLVTRKCLSNPYTGNAEWENIADWKRVECLNDTKETIITQELLERSKQPNVNLQTVFGLGIELALFSLGSNLLPNYTSKILPADIFVFLRALRNQLSSKDFLPSLNTTREMFGIFSVLMRMPSTILRLSNYYNTTNAFLSTFEQYMDKLSAITLLLNSQCVDQNYTAETDNTSTFEYVELKHIGVFGYITANISVFFVDPSCANITGIAIYNAPSNGRLQTQYGYWYRLLQANESIAAVMTKDMELACLMHETLWESISQQKKNKSQVLVFKVYANAKLFVESGSILKRKPVSQILSISIPNFTSRLPEELRFAFRRPNTDDTQNFGCGYWNYEKWLSSDVDTKPVEDGFTICSTKHLTQFSLLLGGAYKQGDLSDAVLIHPLHSRILDHISLYGCSLSLLGLLGIGLTAALFSSWRRLTSTKVLLNLCLVLSIEMLLFLFVNTEHISEALVFKGKTGVCILIGAALQYIILVHFSWMFIIALLQFQRYITIVGVQRPKNYILKAAIIAWSLPLLPTTLSCWLRPADYVPTLEQLLQNMRVCYPAGPALSFGIILPVVLIISANLVVFINVFRNISLTLVQSRHRMKKSLLMSQIRLAILLFFLLGLTWIFGLLAYIRAGVVFSYLFCLTASSQGFVLFLFFVLIDSKARNVWRNHLPCSKILYRTSQQSEARSVKTISVKTLQTSVDLVQAK